LGIERGQAAATVSAADGLRLNLFSTVRTLLRTRHFLLLSPYRNTREGPERFIPRATRRRRRVLRPQGSSTRITPISMISASHLTKAFGPFTAISDVSFEVERG